MGELSLNNYSKKINFDIQLNQQLQYLNTLISKLIPKIKWTIRKK